MHCSGSHSNPAQQGLPVMNLYGRTMASKSIYESRPKHRIAPSVRPSVGVLSVMTILQQLANRYAFSGASLTGLLSLG